MEDRVRADPRSTELARLEVERRLTQGAAHAANNALTAILGEASMLQDEHKHRPDVAEACDAIKAEVERCGRIWRSVLSPLPSTNHVRGQVDLVRLVADLGLLLGRTLSRRVDLVVRVPDEAPVAAVDAEPVELLLLALIHHATDLHPGALRMELSLAPTEGGVEARIHVQTPDLVDDAESALIDPERGTSEAMRCALAALTAALRSAGAQLRVDRTGEGASVALGLPAAAA